MQQQDTLLPGAANHAYKNSGMCTSCAEHMNANQLRQFIHVKLRSIFNAVALEPLDQKTIPEQKKFAKQIRDQVRFITTAITNFHPPAMDEVDVQNLKRALSEWETNFEAYVQRSSSSLGKRALLFRTMSAVLDAMNEMLASHGIMQEAVREPSDEELEQAMKRTRLRCRLLP